LCGSDATAILRKVQELALSPPSKVTQQDLEALAKLCLCREHHSGQWPETAQRWKPVVAKATKHHERFSKGQDPAVSESQLIIAKLGLEQFQKTLFAARTELADSEERRQGLEKDIELAKIAESKLAGELVATHKLLDEERVKITTLEEEMARRVQEGGNELTEARRLFEEARVSMAKQAALMSEQRDHSLAEERKKVTRLEQEIRDLGHRLSEASTKAERLLSEEKSKTRLLDETQAALMRRLSEAEAKSADCAAKADRARRENEALSRDKAAAAQQFGLLQTDLEGVRAEIRRRTDHGSVLERELNMARIDNQALRSAHSQLTAQNTELCEQISALENALAKSWHRRLSAWMHKVSPPKSQTLAVQAAGPGPPTQP
jgi:chromosome segregation ATPase